MVKEAYAAVDFSQPAINTFARFNNIAAILNLIIPILSAFGALIMFIIMIYAGWTIITAGGDPEKLQKAKRTLVSSIIGLGFIIASTLIVNLVSQIVGFTPIDQLQ